MLTPRAVKSLAHTQHTAGSAAPLRITLDRGAIGLTATDVGPLTALFRVTPEEFIARRNQLAAELRRAGKPTEATAVAKLPRPTPAVWAVNQVAHRDRAAVDRLL